MDFPLYSCPDPDIITRRQVHIDVGESYDRENSEIYEDWDLRARNDWRDLDLDAAVESVESGPANQEEGKDPHPSSSFAIVGGENILHFTHALGKICPSGGFKFRINPLVEMDISNLIQLFVGFQTHYGTRSIVDCTSSQVREKFEDFINDTVFWTNGENLRGYSLGMNRFQAANRLLVSNDFEQAAIEYQNILSLVHRIKDPGPIGEFRKLRHRLIAKIFRNILWAYIGMVKNHSERSKQESREVWVKSNLDTIRTYIGRREKYLDGANLFWLIGLVEFMLDQIRVRDKATPMRDCRKKVLKDLRRALKNEASLDPDKRGLLQTIETVRLRYEILTSAPSRSGAQHLEFFLSKAPQPFLAEVEPLSACPLLERKILQEYLLLRELGSKRIGEYEALITTLGLGHILCESTEMKVPPEVLRCIQLTEQLSSESEDLYRTIDTEGLSIKVRVLKSQFSSLQRTTVEF
ncbi:hypothetical protein TWF569_000251 [Orbilia oligospora]|nr:hypothetical protein TWF569_000251 [Orbilia oligospora]